MLRFDALERHGAAFAGISGLEEGDCGWQTEAESCRARWLTACSLNPGHLASVRQEHGCAVATIAESERGSGADRNALGSAPEADAMITDVPGLPLGITVADCVPVFLVAPVAVGLAHAGREGTRLNIAAATVEALERSFAVHPRTVWAVIGPSAGPCCYEVSPAMADEWRGAGLPAHGRRLDLWECNRRQLVEAGVPERQVVVAARCTICGGGFHSYRRHGGRERNLAVLCR